MSSEWVLLSLYIALGTESSYFHVSFLVHMAVKFHIVVFWLVTPFSLVGWCQCYCLQDRRCQQLCSSKTFVLTHQTTTQCHNSGDHSMNDICVSFLKLTWWEPFRINPYCNLMQLKTWEYLLNYVSVKIYDDANNNYSHLLSKFGRLKFLMHCIPVFWFGINFLSLHFCSLYLMCNFGFRSVVAIVQGWSCFTILT
jgi:hypothetical protein